MTALNLDLGNVKVGGGSTDFVPAGVYNAKTISAEGKETRSGYAVKVFFEIMNTEYAGSVVSNMYNIKNANKDAERIALEQIKTLMTVGGAANPNALKDTNDLVGLTVKIHTKDGEFQGDNGPVKVTNIKKVSKFEGAVIGDRGSSNETVAASSKANPWD